MKQKLLLFLSLIAFNIAWAKPLIYIDPGHTPKYSGSQGTCETSEVWVNDNLSLKLARLLQADGYPVEFSRLPNLDKSLIDPSGGREPGESLRRRGKRANNLNAALFISIHHDSVAEEHLVAAPVSVCNGVSLLSPFNPLMISEEFLSEHEVGFNIFISPPGNAPNKYKKSLRLAEYIGEGFVAEEEPITDFHTPEFEEGCGSCKWANQDLGVLSRNLAVTRVPKMPALLVEVTNLKVPSLEAKANSSDYQDKVASYIKAGIDKYFE